jgi:hypothetical protein
MVVKVVPRGEFESYESFECRRYRFQYASDLKDNPPSREFLNSFTCEVHGPEPLEGAPVVLRLDRNGPDEQSIIITAVANVYVMSDQGQTIDRFQVS